MFGYQATRKNSNGVAVDETDVYDGGKYFATSVEHMISQMQTGDTITIKTVKKD